MQSETPGSLRDIAFAFRQNKFDVLTLVTIETLEFVGNRHFTFLVFFFMEGAFDLIDIGRFHEVTDRAEFGGLHGCGDASVTGEYDDPGAGALGKDLRDRIEAGVGAESKIDDSKVDRETFHGVEGREIPSALDGVAPVAKLRAKGFGKAVVVLDDEYRSACLFGIRRS